MVKKIKCALNNIKKWFNIIYTDHKPETAFIFLFVLAFSVKAQSLDDYLRLAETNNPAIQAKRAEFEAAMQRIPQVSSLPDPELSASAFGQMMETRVGQQQARLSLSQMFPWFGTLAAQKHAAALAAEAAYQSYLNAQNELFFNVRSAYYPLYELQQIIAVRRRNLELLETMKRLATTSFRNGNGKLVDALQVDVMVNEIETEIAILELKGKPLTAAFNALLNRPADAEVIVPDAFDQQSFNAVRDSVFANNPKVTELEFRLEAAKASEFAAVKQGMPKMGIGFEYIIIEERPGMDFPDNGRDAYMPMVTMSLPVFRKKYRAAVEEAKYRQEAFALMKTASLNQLTSEYEMAVFERTRAETELDLYNRQVVETQRVIDLMRSEYENTGADFETILRLQQALLMYETKRIAAMTAWHLANAKLIYVTANDLTNE